jgi:4'-phosphopantetheinyl transferase
MPMNAPTVLTLHEGEVHVWYVWTAACDTPAQRAYYQSLLSHDESERLARLALERVRLEYWVTRALCRTMLSACTDIDTDTAPQNWRFRTGQYGRPEIDHGGLPPPLRFNVSHAPGLVACAVTRSADIGIDVEDTERRCDAEEIVQRYFAPQEWAAFSALPMAQRRRRFFELWTLKESYLKASGEGLSRSLNEAAFALSETSIGVTFAAHVADCPDGWQFALHDIGSRHLMALSVRRGKTGPLAVSIREVMLQASGAALPSRQ